MPRADLDDAVGLLASHQGVGGGRVEAREPVLGEARRPLADEIGAAGTDAGEIGRVRKKLLSATGGIIEG